MTSFKILRGLKAKMPSVKIDGFLYFCTDTGDIYFDYLDATGTVQRQSITADEANLLSGASLNTILESSDSQIPTSKAVMDYVQSNIGEAVGDIDCGQFTDTESDANKIDCGTF